MSGDRLSERLDEAISEMVWSMALLAGIVDGEQQEAIDELKTAVESVNENVMDKLSILKKSEGQKMAFEIGLKSIVNYKDDSLNKIKNALSNIDGIEETSQQIIDKLEKGFNLIEEEINEKYPSNEQGQGRG